MVQQERLESALKELVKSGELSSVALLNASGAIVASAGPIGDFEIKGMLQSYEHWDPSRVTLVNLVDLGTSVTREGETNSRTIVLPPRQGPPPPPPEEPPPNPLPPDPPGVEAIVPALETVKWSMEEANVVKAKGPAPTYQLVEGGSCPRAAKA